MDNPADLINVAIEHLIKERFELSDFGLLNRLVLRVRNLLNRRLFQTILRRLTPEQLVILDQLTELEKQSFRTPYQDDGGFLLVSPTGQKVRLMTDCGGDNTTNNITVNLTFDDAATTAPNCSALVPTGTYKPTVGLATSPTGGATHPANFPAPAPVAAYSLLLSNFNGANPNGVWSLYVDDDSNQGAGTLTSWSLTVTAPRPTAAGTTVGGRVTQQHGNGIRNAQVTMLDSMGIERFAVTDGQGFYQFEDVSSGLVYVFLVAHLRYQFDQPAQVQFIGEETNGINFTGTSFTRFGDLWTVRNPLWKE